MALAGELATSVFRSKGGDMAIEYPLLFRAGPKSQLHIFMHGGNVVSMVGMTIFDASVRGCTTRLAYNNDVAHPTCIPYLTASAKWVSMPSEDERLLIF